MADSTTGKHDLAAANSSSTSQLDAPQNNQAQNNTPQLTHIDERGEVRMVDVGAKPDTERLACAEGTIFMNPSTLNMIVDGTAPKGDVLATARIGGIMGAKRTSDLIPMCHPLLITKAKVELEPFKHDDGKAGIYVRTTCGVTGKTGIEMEALTACATACLTIYDMCKAVDRGMEISNIRLLKKTGGKCGTWERESSHA